MKRNRFLALACTVVLGTAALGFAQKKTQHDIDVQRDRAFAQASTQQGHMMMHDQMMANPKVGKTGDLRIKRPTIVGEVTLQPGDYEVQHVSSPEGHYLEITRVSWDEVWYNINGYSSSNTELRRAPVARVNCDLKPLHVAVKRTALIASADRKVNGLEIRGENVEHVF